MAADVIKDYIKDVPFLELQNAFGDAIYALEYLQYHRVDLIFLDIHLPKIKGFEFVKTLHDPPDIIVTTAYHQYALEGFELDVVDYLLKPIEFSRFLKAVNKVYQRRPIHNETSPTPKKSDRTFQFVQSNKIKKKIFHDEILYIESVKEYLHIHTLSDEVVIHGRMEDLDRMFDQVDLIRIHRSFSVATGKVTGYSASKIHIEDISLPIGRTFKEAVNLRLGSS